MRLAVNYSPTLAALVEAGQVEVDVFKCPTWENLVGEAQKTRPVYIHFPLMVGRGTGTAYDGERRAEVDWCEIDNWLACTDTPYLNLHLEFDVHTYPDIPRDAMDPAFVERCIENGIKDVTAVQQRYGKDKVIVENLYAEDSTLLITCLPQAVRAVVEQTGAGLLFDVSHARLAAETLGIPYDDYFAALPLHTTRELHLTGIQYFGDEWVAYMEAAGLDAATARRYAYRRFDHLPLTDEDWMFWAKVLTDIREGRIAEPWCAALEVGGVSGIWEAIGTREMYLDQLPRLYNSLYPQPA